MGLDTSVEKYDSAPRQDLRGNRGVTTGIANILVKFRPVGTVAEGNLWSKKGKWDLGILKGDTKIADVIETFKNQTGARKKTIGNQKVSGSTELVLNLMNLTPYAKNLMHGSNLPFVVSYTTHPGTRLSTITLSTAIATGNTFAWSFKTKNIDTGVESSLTAVNVVFATDSATTYASIISAIEANSGILASGTAVASDVITVTARPGYIITTTVAPSVTGGTPPTVTVVNTDTSIVATTIDETNGAIDYRSFGVDDASKFRKGMQIEVETGDADNGTMMEYPYVKRVNTTTNVIYLNEALAQLPANLADVKCVADITYHSGTESLPEDIEIFLEEHDHSDKSVDLLHIFTASLSAKDGPFRTAEGEEGSLTFACLEDLVDDGSGNEIYQAYRRRTVNSVTGTY